MSEVQLVDVTFKAPKEMNDVRLALVSLVEKLASGETIGQAVMEDLGALQTAAVGVMALPEEAKTKVRESAGLVGFMAGDLAGLLLAPKAVVPTLAPPAAVV